MGKQNSFVLLWQPASLSNFRLFLWQLKHLEITFAPWRMIFFFLPLAVRVIRILISKVECREENDWKKKKAYKRSSFGGEIKGQPRLPHGVALSSMTPLGQILGTSAHYCPLASHQHLRAEAPWNTIPTCHSKWSKSLKAPRHWAALLQCQYQSL